MILSRKLRRRLLSAASEEWRWNMEAPWWDRLELALRRTPDGPLNDADLSDIHNELALSDNDFIVLAIDYYGLDQYAQG